jgi:hypothetical protein
MTQREKLPALIRQNPKAVRFDDACKAPVGWASFTMADKAHIECSNVPANRCN